MEYVWLVKILDFFRGIKKQFYTLQKWKRSTLRVLFLIGIVFVSFLLMRQSVSASELGGAMTATSNNLASEMLAMVQPACIIAVLLCAVLMVCGLIKNAKQLIISFICGVFCIVFAKEIIDFIFSVIKR